MDHAPGPAPSGLLTMVDAGIDALTGSAGPHRAAADGRLHTALLAAVQLHGRRGPLDDADVEPPHPGRPAPAVTEAAVVLVRAACASLRAREFAEARAVLVVVHDALTSSDVDGAADAGTPAYAGMPGLPHAWRQRADELTG